MGRPEDEFRGGILQQVWQTLCPTMVAVAQLAERQVVVLNVAGSIPVGHPNARSWAALRRHLHCGRQMRL